jgi:hypothetical protein
MQIAGPRVAAKLQGADPDDSSTSSSKDSKKAPLGSGRKETPKRLRGRNKPPRGGASDLTKYIQKKR